MKSIARLLTLGVVAVASSLSIPAAAGQPSPAVFKAATKEGRVWVSVDLTRQRLTEPYVPFVVAIYNDAKDSVVLRRENLKLIGPDGKAYGVPTIAELRTSYTRQNFDMTILRMYGIPFGTWLQPDRLVPSNFFPLVLGRGRVRIDHVQIPPLYWTVDLFYFQRPPGLAAGQEVELEVQPKGWKEPVRIPVKL
jgi:hypothetical protein